MFILEQIDASLASRLSSNPLNTVLTAMEIPVLQQSGGCFPPESL